MECTTYVGCVIAEVSVAIEADRFNKLNQTPFCPLLIVGACFGARIGDYIPQKVLFHNVHCQF